MLGTKNGIYYNLEHSPYKAIINGWEYYFSSKLHLQKFLEQRDDNRLKLSDSLYKRFKVWININELYDAVLYAKIETRGFLIIFKGVKYKCLNQLKLNGVRKIETQSPEPWLNLMQN